MGDLELGEDDGVGAERVRLDHVAAGLEEVHVNLLDGVGARDEQVLRAVLELRPAVVLHRQPLRVQVRPHRAVEDDDAVFSALENRC